MSFIGLIIDFLESRNLENLGLVGITTRQPEDKISIFKTFYVPIKHFMSKYTVFVSNLIYFSNGCKTKISSKLRLPSASRITRGKKQKSSNDDTF